MESSDVVLLIEAREAVRTGRAARVRHAAGLSQGEVAAAIGVSAPCVSRWEAGDRRPHGVAAVAYGALLRQLAMQVALHAEPLLIANDVAPAGTGARSRTSTAAAETRDSAISGA